MVAEVERLETAARLAMAHFPDNDPQAAKPFQLLGYYLRLTSVAAVVVLSGLIGFSAF
ncbi:MAG TPA: hypothetical protein VGN97_14620 [Mesorhizobium sp.]|jgi:hypothetical protein|nr:hypothetical protein [Mesorhizobium sp.]